ncbi:MAG TPA: hypothetical protein VME01_00280 [Solirubrobacteraceae bacterium]|nr:hypothetical protein [Solirubrobacteraceae bacterium]
MTEQPEQPPEAVTGAQSTEHAAQSAERPAQSTEHAAQHADLPISVSTGSSRAQELPSLPAPHAHKFRAATAVLSVIAAVAIAVAVIVGSENHTRVVSHAWSSWVPSSGGSTGVQEIADFVAPFYRRSAAAQMDVVTPISLTNETAAGTSTGTGLTVAVNPSSSSGSASDDDTLELLTGTTVAYNICGIGGSGNCSLAGTPTTARMLLLRREALELALYTLKYTSAQNVLVVLPPGHTVSTSGASATQPITVAVLFSRAELAPLLNIPIDESLNQDPPLLSQVAAWSKSDEAGLVDQITEHGLFSEQIQSQQEGGSLLVLSPLPAQ